MLCRHRKSMAEFTTDVTRGSPSSGYLGSMEGGPPPAWSKGCWCRQAGSREVDRTQRRQVERVNPPSLHQQREFTKHWDRASIAPISLPPFQLPKEVPQPSEGYFERKTTGCCYMAQSFGTARVILKVKGNKWRNSPKVIANRWWSVGRSCTTLIRISG